MNQTEIKKKQLMLFLKIFGLVTMIILTNLIGNLGTIYFIVPLELFWLLSTAFIDHVPEYMEKMIRYRMAKEQYKNADKVFQTVLFYCFVIGLLIGLILFCLSEIIASKIFMMREVALVMKLLAPAFLFSALGAALQGYFQGMGTAMPSVIYHVVKQLFSLTFSLLFGYILLQYGKNVSALLLNEHYSYMYGAAGVALGITTASLVADFFLLIIYAGAGRRIRKQEGLRLTEDGIEVGRQFVSFILPASGYQVVLHLPLFISLLFFVRKPGNDVSFLGAYYVGYLVICSIIIVCALFMITSKESVLINLVKREEIKIARNYLSAGLQALFIFTCFFATLVVVLSDSLLHVLFQDSIFTNEIVKCMLPGAGIIILFPISRYLANILIGIGKRKTAMLSMLVSFILYIVVFGIVSQTVHNDILVITIGLVVFCLSECFINAFFLFRIFHYNPDWFRVFVIPIAASFLTGACLFLLKKGLVALAGELLAFIICVLLGSMSYIILLFVSKCVREKDLNLIPCANVIRKVGMLLHLL